MTDPRPNEEMSEQAFVPKPYSEYRYASKAVSFDGTRTDPSAWEGSQKASPPPTQNQGASQSNRFSLFEPDEIALFGEELPYRMPKNTPPPEEERRNDPLNVGYVPLEEAPVLPPEPFQPQPIPENTDSGTPSDESPKQEGKDPPKVQLKKRSGTPSPKSKRKKTIAVRTMGLIVGACLVIFIILFAGYLLRELRQNELNGSELSGRLGQYVAAASVTPAPTQQVAAVYSYPKNDVYSDSSRSTPKQYKNNSLTNLLPEVKEYQTENADARGKLTIPGLLEERIFQNNNMYYLTHDGYGDTSSKGAVYVNPDVSFKKKPPENIILHGLSSYENSVFYSLSGYVSGGEGFARSYARASLLTPYDEEEYILFSVFQISSSEHFYVDDYISFSSDRAMMDYVAQVRQRSLYSFAVDVEPSDRLLTISTISTDGVSTVLVFRALREGEAFQ